MMNRRQISILAIVAATLAVAWGVYRLFIKSVTPTNALNFLANHYPIPPGFDDQRLVFAFALAGLLTISVLATHVLLEDIRFLRSFKKRWKEPAKLSTTVEILLLLTIVMGFAPDAILLLAWGDPSAPSAASMSSLDRTLDFLCIIPFVSAWLLRARGQRVVQYQLMRFPIPSDLTPSWGLLRPKIVMLFVVFALSVGVALAK